MALFSQVNCKDFFFACDGIELGREGNRSF